MGSLIPVEPTFQVNSWKVKGILKRGFDEGHSNQLIVLVDEGNIYY